MSANPSSHRKHLVDIVILLSLGLPVLFICVMVFIISYGLSTPPAPTPAPSEIAARARARDAHVAAAKTQTPGLVKETGVITLPLGQSANWAVVYFDGVRLWASLERQLIALDPEAREFVLGPIELRDPPFGMIFAGQRLWISDLAGLYPIDVESGQRGTAIQVYVNPYSMVYDGAHIWFAHPPEQIELIQAIDPVSREVFPPVETVITFPPALILDMSRHVLWLIDPSGNVQSHDLRRKLLRDTSFRFDNVRTGPAGSVLFDGQRLWAIRIGQPEPESIGQSLDVDTGKVTQLPGSLTAIGSSVFDGKRIWLSNDDGTVQPFDTITGQLGTPIPIYGYPGALAFDGKRLWIALYDNPGIGIPYGERHFVGLQYIIPH